MGKSKRPWLLNGLVVVTIIVCLLAFIAHFKNWTETGQQNFQILSGLYYKQVEYTELDSVELIDKIPPMERLNGFSAMDSEKGVFREFKDSLTDKKVYVYIDNFEHQKIKLVYNDSLKLYLNLSDSLKTDQLYQFLLEKKDMALSKDTKN